MAFVLFAEDIVRGHKMKIKEAFSSAIFALLNMCLNYVRAGLASVGDDNDDARHVNANQKLLLQCGCKC